MKFFMSRVIHQFVDNSIKYFLLKVFYEKKNLHNYYKE